MPRKLTKRRERSLNQLKSKSPSAEERHDAWKKEHYENHAVKMSERDEAKFNKLRSPQKGESGMKFGEGGKTRRLTRLVRKSLGEDKAKRGTIAASEYKAGQANRASGKANETSKAKDVKIAEAVQRSADEGKSRRAARITKLAYGESKKEKQESSGNRRSGLGQKVRDVINRSSASRGGRGSGSGRVRTKPTSAKQNAVDFNKMATKGRKRASRKSGCNKGAAWCR